MTGAGIYDGDLLVVDRSIEPVHGQVVIAAINDDLTVKLTCPLLPYHLLVGSPG